MTPGQLVHAVAVALDVSEGTVVLHDRNLAAAGLRTKGGRGPSAAKVTPLDAARLFVATLTSVKVTDSVEMLQTFEALRFDPAYPTAEIAATRGRAFSDPAVLALPPDHNLVDAIAALIGDASRPPVDQVQYLQRFASLMVTCETPWARADITHFERPITTAHYRRPSRPSSGADVPFIPDPPVYQMYMHAYGVRQRRAATGSAIILLGKAFREDGLDFETPREAMDDLMGVKKPANKSKKKAA